MHEYIPNYGFVLIIFSFLIKILVYPLTKKSYQSTAAMQVVQPEINALREKYKNNSQKLNQATMKLCANVAADAAFVCSFCCLSDND